MRIRQLLETKKTQTTDSSWSVTDMPPRHAPIYAKSRPIRAGWKWRSAQATAGSDKFIMVALCNPSRDNWKAMLIKETGSGPSVVARFEYHGSHPGVHAHAHCDRGGIEVGSTGLDNLVRTPPAEAYHRRTNAWTENTFWEASKRFFRIEEDKGPLFSHAP